MYSIEDADAGTNASRLSGAAILMRYINAKGNPVPKNYESYAILKPQDYEKKHWGWRLIDEVIYDV